MRMYGDVPDGLVTLGVLLLGTALGMWFGLAAVLAYAGTVLALLGLALAVRSGGK